MAGYPSYTGLQLRLFTIQIPIWQYHLFSPIVAIELVAVNNDCEIRDKAAPIYKTASLCKAVATCIEYGPAVHLTKYIL